jgi:hypothetical protein
MFKTNVKKQFKAKNCEKKLFGVTREHVLTRTHIYKYSESQMVFSFAILLNTMTHYKKYVIMKPFILTLNVNVRKRQQIPGLTLANFYALHETTADSVNKPNFANTVPIA